MKSTPLLFSDAMVRRVLDGTKTQTRRLVKPQPRDAEGIPVVESCPFGGPGDRLWIRECWCSGRGLAAVDAPAFLAPPGATPAPAVLYRADGVGLPPGVPWKPSIHMPRWACRLELEIASVRVERVQDISDKDIRAEGVDLKLLTEILRERCRSYPVRRGHWVWTPGHAEYFCDRHIDRALQAEENPEAARGSIAEDCDTQPFCESCGVALEFDGTDYFTECECEHFSTHDASAPADAYALMKAVEYVDLDALPPERRTAILRIAWRELWTATYGAASWDANPWVWAITFKRAESPVAEVA
jgi:hypothetical protein